MPLYDSHWNWQIFFWAFLHGKLTGNSRLYFSFYYRWQVYPSICFSVIPYLDWDLIDEFGEKVLGIRDWSFNSIPF